MPVCNAYNLRHRNEAILDIARAMQLAVADLPEFPPRHRIGGAAVGSGLDRMSSYRTKSLACGENSGSSTIRSSAPAIALLVSTSMYVSPPD